MTPPLPGAPWRVLAVDDEPPALLALEQALRPSTDFTLVATSTDPLAVAGLVRDTQPDVLLLDIQMPGLSGFDVLAQLVEPLPLVVFVTAYHEFAVQAFEAQALDYVLKPIDPARLARTLDAVRARLREQRAAALLPQLRAVLQALDARAATPRTAISARIPLRVDGRTLYLDPALVDRVESDDNTVTWFVGRERYAVRDTLTHVEAVLPPTHFARVHRSVIVNLARVRTVEPSVHGEYVIQLVDGTRVVTGRSYRETVRATFRLGDA